MDTEEDTSYKSFEVRGSSTDILEEGDLVCVKAKVVYLKWTDPTTDMEESVKWNNLTQTQQNETIEWFTNMSKERRLYHVLDRAINRLANRCDGATSWDVDLEKAIVSFAGHSGEFSVTGRLVETPESKIKEWMPPGAHPPYVYKKTDSPVPASVMYDLIIDGMWRSMQASGAYLYDVEGHEDGTANPKRYYGNVGGPNLRFIFKGVQIFLQKKKERTLDSHNAEYTSLE